MLIVAAVDYRKYKIRLLSEHIEKVQPEGMIADVKCQFDVGQLAARGVGAWRLS